MAFQEGHVIPRIPQDVLQQTSFLNPLFLLHEQTMQCLLLAIWHVPGLLQLHIWSSKTLSKYAKTFICIFLAPPRGKFKRVCSETTNLQQSSAKSNLSCEKILFLSFFGLSRSLTILMFRWRRATHSLPECNGKLTAYMAHAFFWTRWLDALSDTLCSTLFLGTLARHSCLTLLLDTLSWHSFLDTLAWHFSVTLFARHSCLTLLLDTLAAWHPFLTLFAGHSFLALLLDTLAGHSCRTLLLDTLSWHSFLDTLAWHFSVTLFARHSCLTLLLDTLACEPFLTLFARHSF